MKRGIGAIGRLAATVILLTLFLFSMGTVVYMSLQGKEVKVPEITGKDLSEGERELASLGLKIKKRADRFSEETPNTVIEQLPKPGETVKTGQLILVVTSKGPGEGNTPTSLKKNTEEDDSEKIEEMISDKPKKTKANSNTNRKKAEATRDVAGNSEGTSEGDNKNDGATPANKKEPSTTTPPNERPTPRPAGNTRPSGGPAGRPASVESGNRPAPRPR
ncbi:MAG: PASTA domain-containing protein [Acidobacteria bacterium]|nr:PASTA domain-containing protein [Acidobacteriota bacterium]